MHRNTKTNSRAAFAPRITPQTLLIRAFIAFVFLIGSVLIVQFTWTAAKAAWGETNTPPAITTPAPEIPEPGKPDIEIGEPDLA